MEYSQEVFFAPRFDFAEFLNTGFLTDCSIFLGPEGTDAVEIKAHVLVLANSSQYFHDMFTGEMKESNTHKVYVTHNPQNLLPRVIRYMYTGKIRFEFSETMSLYSIARFYKIQSLEEDIQAEIQNICTAENIFALVDQCFDEELISELKFLEPFIAKFFFALDMKVITDKLDVQTFAHSLKHILNKFTPEKLLDTISQFLGEGYEFEEEDEQNALLELLNTEDKKLASLIKSKKLYWIPESFISKLK